MNRQGSVPTQRGGVAASPETSWNSGSSPCERKEPSFPAMTGATRSQRVAARGLKRMASTDEDCRPRLARGLGSTESTEVRGRKTMPDSTHEWPESPSDSGAPRIRMRAPAGKPPHPSNLCQRQRTGDSRREIRRRATEGNPGGGLLRPATTKRAFHCRRLDCSVPGTTPERLMRGGLLAGAA